jgi:hypothetical protein
MAPEHPVEEIRSRACRAKHEKVGKPLGEALNSGEIRRPKAAVSGSDPRFRRLDNLMS